MWALLLPFLICVVHSDRADSLNSIQAGTTRERNARVSPKLFSRTHQLVDKKTRPVRAQVGSVPAYRARLELINRSQRVSKCFSWLLLVCRTNFDPRTKLSIAGVKLTIPQAHGVCSFAYWVTRTHWHNTHFNCLLLFIYRMCFIGIITVLWKGNESAIICFVQSSFSAFFFFWWNRNTWNFPQMWEVRSSGVQSRARHVWTQK